MNRRSFAILVLVSLVGLGLATQQCSYKPSNFSPGSTTAAPSNTRPIKITSTSATCYFVWASHDIPELTKGLQKSVQNLQPQAQAQARAYGEDCVYADGHAEFTPMETDYYITLYVVDLSDEYELGGWISKMMSVLEMLPPKEIPGPQPGFAEFKFMKGSDEYVILRVPISSYQAEGHRLEGAELFSHYYKRP